MSRLGRAQPFPPLLNRGNLVYKNLPTQINATVGQVTWAGQAANVATNISISAAVGAVTWAGLAATVQVGVTLITAAVGQVTVAGQAASIAVVNNITASLGQVTWAGLQFSLDQPMIQAEYFQDGNRNTPINAAWLNGVNQELYTAFNTITGTSYTMGLLDDRKVTTFTNPAAVTVTIPNNSTVNFPINHVLRVSQLGTGTVTVQGASGVTLQNVNSSFVTPGQYGMLHLQQTSTLNTWVVWSY